jgi:hypothetical protein
MISDDRWAFPNDPELTTLNITLPLEDLAAIDDAVERITSLADREDFILLAVEYALASLQEEAEAAMLGLEDE